jgi:hypothetical protein
MFVGHLAVGLIGKRLRPELSLGWFMAAATALDLLWPLFLLLGIEHVRIVPGAMAFNPLVFDSYPWSHSLLMAVVWGVVLAYLAAKLGAAPQTRLVLGALVVSHWVLDVASHAADMPLWPGPSPRLGLGLWNSVPATLIVEGAVWVVGIWLYLAPRSRTDRVGPIAFWSLVLVTTTMWIAGPWSPPPPSANALAWFALVGWIVLPWAAWADRHYQLRKASP